MNIVKYSNLSFHKLECFYWLFGCSLDKEDGGTSSSNTLKGGSWLQNMQTQTKHHTQCCSMRVLHYTSNQECAQAYFCSQWQVPHVPLAGPPGAQGRHHHACLQTKESRGALAHWSQYLHGLPAHSQECQAIHVHLSMFDQFCAHKNKHHQTPLVQQGKGIE